MLKKNLRVTGLVILVIAVFGSWGHSETFSFTNTTPLIFSLPTRSSHLEVSGVVGNVLDVNVTLSRMKTNVAINGIEEFDVLLVGPQGTSIILISFVCDFTFGPVDFTLDDSAANSLPMGDTSVICASGSWKPTDFHEFGDGYIIDSPPAPAPPYSTHLSDLNGLNPNGTWTIYAEEFLGNEGGTIESWTITIETDSVEACLLFNDQFDDNIVDWNIIKPNVVESNGNTTLVPANKKGEIEADNVFSGCSGNCIVDTAFQTTGGMGGKAWVIGWYIDKQNLVELLFREDKNRVIIRQRINKTVVAKASADFIIDPNTWYSATMTYDGSSVSVSLNGGSPLLTLNPVGPLTGSVGIRATNTMGTFTHMCVD